MDLTTHTSLITNTAWVHAWLGKLQKRVHLTRSDKVYQLLAHGRWFSPGTPASSTTKTGRHDIAEILLNVALNIKIKSILMFCFYLQCQDVFDITLTNIYSVFTNKRFGNQKFNSRMSYFSRENKLWSKCQNGYFKKKLNRIWRKML